MTVHGIAGSHGGVVSAWVAVELVPEQDTGLKKIQLVEVQHVQEILLSKNHVMTVPAVKVQNANWGLKNPIKSGHHKCILGGVKSLVSRYNEGYSFWGI